MKHLRTLNKFFLKYKWKLILGLVVTIISRIFGLYFIPLVGNSTDAIEQYINGEIDTTFINRPNLSKFWKKEVIRKVNETLYD